LPAILISLRIGLILVLKPNDTEQVSIDARLNCDIHHDTIRIVLPGATSFIFGKK